MSGYSLLTIGKASPKGKKGEKFGYVTAILHFAPSDLSGVEMCAMAKLAGCYRPCLNFDGHGGIVPGGGEVTFDSVKAGTITNHIQKARLRRTNMFNFEREAFMALLQDEIRRFVNWARKKNLIPVVRLNGTSDVRWEDVSIGRVANIFAVFDDIQFYDYTKLPNRRRALSIPNYHLTFSYSHRPEFAPIVVKALQTYGTNINFAVVFKGEEMPTHFLGRRVESGDDTDLRFLDAPGIVTGLMAKGRSARRDVEGFMVP